MLPDLMTDQAALFICSQQAEDIKCKTNLLAFDQTFYGKTAEDLPGAFLALALMTRTDFLYIGAFHVVEFYIDCSAGGRYVHFAFGCGIALRTFGLTFFLGSG